MPFLKMLRRGRAQTTTVSPEFETLINSALAKLQHLKPEPSEFEHRGSKRSLDAALLAAAAQERGLDVLKLTNTMQIISGESTRLGFFQNMCWTLTTLDRALTNDKQLTKLVLRREGLPVADGDVVRNIAGAVKTFRRIGRPVVVKPIRGSGGKGITVHIRTEDELVDAATTLLARVPRILIEESVPSVDLRVMVVAGRTVATMMRVPAHVDGNGVSTIDELITEKNRLRASNAYLRHVPIKLDEAMKVRLTSRGLSPQSVPARGERVFLHYKANLGSGGDSFEITGQIHPSITKVAEQALRCFTSAHHAGIDLLIERIDAPADEQRVVVCEVNLNNDMPIHVFPLYGTPVATGRRSIDGYFFSGRDLVPTQGTTPAVEYTDHLAFTPGSVQGWPELIGALSSPAKYDPDLVQARSPRRLDQHCLSQALEDRGYTSVRYTGRLIHARRRGAPVVFDRCGASMFTMKLAERTQALEKLLTTSGIEACRSRLFRPDDLAGAVRFASTFSGPWSARTAEAGDQGTVVFHDTADLEQIWPNLTQTDSRVVLQQSANTLALEVLLFNGQATATLATCSPAVIGDGLSDVDMLMRRRSQLREGHPYFRHVPTHGAPPAASGTPRVPGAGEWIGLGSAPQVEVSWDTVGLDLHSVTAAERTATQVWEAIGRPRTLTVSLAPSPDRAGDHRVPYAVLAINPDPVLARYAFPWAGKTDDIYSVVAEALETGQSYVLGDVL